MARKPLIFALLVLLTFTTQATYLLTITTIGGKTHTIRLMKMSDIFSR